jgi:hypothetical protein
MDMHAAAGGANAAQAGYYRLLGERWNRWDRGKGWGKHGRGKPPENGIEMAARELWKQIPDKFFPQISNCVLRVPFFLRSTQHVSGGKNFSGGPQFYKLAIMV